MKCPCCNGTGRTQMVTVVKTDDGLPCDFPCIECDGTGEVEMINEYFLRTATTEQLVEAIYECVMANSWNFSKDGIKRWLKQPHKE